MTLAGEGNLGGEHGSRSGPIGTRSDEEREQGLADRVVRTSLRGDDFQKVRPAPTAATTPRELSGGGNANTERTDIPDLTNLGTRSIDRGTGTGVIGTYSYSKKCADSLLLGKLDYSVVNGQSRVHTTTAHGK